MEIKLLHSNMGFKKNSELTQKICYYKQANKRRIEINKAIRKFFIKRHENSEANGTISINKFLISPNQVRIWENPFGLYTRVTPRNRCRYYCINVLTCCRMLIFTLFF